MGDRLRRVTEIKRDSPDAASAALPLAVLHFLGDGKRLARQPTRPTILTAPHQTVGDQESRERLSCTPTDLSRDLNRALIGQRSDACMLVSTGPGTRDDSARIPTPRSTRSPTPDDPRDREEYDRTLVQMETARALHARDMVRHREQVDGLGDATLVLDALENRERFLMIRDTGMRASRLTYQFPTRFRLWAMSDGSSMDRASSRASRRCCAPVVIPGRPQHAKRMLCRPLRATITRLTGSR